MRRALVLLFLAACGKTGGSGAIEGVYHLDGDATATSLEVHADGTFFLRRDPCEGVGERTTGAWRTETALSASVTPSDYWPTPPTFPSAHVDAVQAQSRNGELIVFARNAWFGTFEQRWRRGRAVPSCLTL